MSGMFVGSSQQCGIVLEDETVYPIHARIWRDEQAILRVQDWNTQGKTLLNGEVVEGVNVISIGDRLEVGNYWIKPVAKSDVLGQANIHKSEEPVHRSELERGIDLLSLDSNELPTQQVATESVVDEEIAIDEEPGSSVEVEFNSEPPVSELVVDEPEAFKYQLEDEEDAAMLGYEHPFVDVEPIGLGDEVDLLRLEVEQLRYEAAEHEAQLQSLAGASPDFADSHEENDETLRLVNRLEELLQELQASDDRMNSLEDLLRASEQATTAEQEERLQLEAWVLEIEQRFSQRESESEAIVDRLRKRMVALQTHYKQSQSNLERALSEKDQATPEGASELEKGLQEQLAQREQELKAAVEENDQLEKRMKHDEQEIRTRLQQLEQDFMEQQVSIAQERASLGRKVEKLERLKSEVEQKLNAGKDVSDGDTKIQAMREHLRDIHEHERDEKKRNSLSGRVSRLLHLSKR